MLRESTVQRDAYTEQTIDRTTWVVRLWPVHDPTAKRRPTKQTAPILVTNVLVAIIRGISTRFWLFSRLTIYV